MQAVVSVFLQRSRGVVAVDAGEAGLLGGDCAGGGQHVLLGNAADAACGVPGQVQQCAGGELACAVIAGGAAGVLDF